MASSYFRVRKLSCSASELRRISRDRAARIRSSCQSVNDGSAVSSACAMAAWPDSPVLSESGRRGCTGTCDNRTPVRAEHGVRNVAVAGLEGVASKRRGRRGAVGGVGEPSGHVERDAAYSPVSHEAVVSEIANTGLRARMESTPRLLPESHDVTLKPTPIPMPAPVTPGSTSWPTGPTRWSLSSP